MGHVTGNVSWVREIRGGPVEGAGALSLHRLSSGSAPQTPPADSSGEINETVSDEFCPCFWEGRTVKLV